MIVKIKLSIYVEENENNINGFLLSRITIMYINNTQVKMSENYLTES